MLELLAIFALIAFGLAALFALGVTLKVVLTVLAFPFIALFWILGCVFKILVFPLKLLGGMIFAVIFLPLLLIAFPILLTLGIPLLAVFGILFAIWVVGSILCGLGSLLFAGA